MERFRLILKYNIFIDVARTWNIKHFWNGLLQQIQLLSAEMQRLSESERVRWASHGTQLEEDLARLKGEVNASQARAQSAETTLAELKGLNEEANQSPNWILLHQY